MTDLLTILFAKSLLVGFAVSIPIGPVGILAVRRTVERNARAGFIAGLGAAAADALWAALASSGLTAISDLVMAHTEELRALGGAVLVLIGVRALRKGEPDAPRSREGAIGTLSTCFLLVITNPATFFAMAAALSVLGVADAPTHPSGTLAVVGGVATGACLWWALLSTASAALRERLSSAWLHRLNQVLAALLLAVGVGALAVAAIGLFEPI